MEYFKQKAKVKITLLFCLLLLACEQEPPIPEHHPMGEMPSGDWQYDALVIRGDTFNIVNWSFEPDNPGWELYNVKFRWFNYSSNGTYEFHWDNKIPFNLSPDLVIGDGLNYQPYFGYWILSPNIDTLIHNEGFQYETQYKIIELTEERFIREYQRIIQRIDDLHSEKWGVMVGDTVVYREIFVPRIE